MPSRKPAGMTKCTLRELLNWVAHDDYDGPSISSAEAELAVFGDTSNIEGIELGDFDAFEKEEAAKREILTALSNEEIVARGFVSAIRSTSPTSWEDAQYTGHSDLRTPLPGVAWEVGAVDWNRSSVKTPSEEFLGVHLDRSEVEGIWVLENQLVDDGLTTSQRGPSYTEFKDSLLVALARADAEEGSGYREPMDIADRYGLTYSPGWLRKATTDFRDMGYVNDAFTLGGGEDRGLSCSITGPGLEAAEELALNLGLTISEASPLPPQDKQADNGGIPASDRVVRRSDNEEAWDEAAEGVKQLRAAMEAANDYGGLDENEFQQKLAEVRALQIYLDSPQVQWESLERIATRTIAALAGIFTVSVIGDLSTKLLGPLGDILGKSILGGP